MPPEGQIDVNNVSVPSADPGVQAVPPAASPETPPDVKTSLLVPSAEELPATPPVKPHEDSVPYDRFSEVNEQNKQLKAQLDAALAAAPAPAEPPDNGNANWDALGLTSPAAEPAPAQNNGQLLPDEVELKLRDELYERPYATMAPIIQELARQVIKQERQQESQVRRMPDFQSYETSYYNVPDDLVMQTQGNPEVVRYLIAKHQATLKGTPPPPPPASMQELPTQNNPAAAPPVQIPSAAPAGPAKTMDELRAQYMAEGERLAMEKMRRQSGVTSEPATTVTTPATDEPELDEYGKNFMKNLGIPAERLPNVAKRLQQG
jgi:hypothetical protein